MPSKLAADGSTRYVAEHVMWGTSAAPHTQRSPRPPRLRVCPSSLANYGIATSAHWFAPRCSLKMRFAGLSRRAR